MRNEIGVKVGEALPWILYGPQRAAKLVKPPAMKYSEEANKKLFIYLNSITDLPVDAITNAANNSLLGGGGVDGAIHRAAGRELYKECKTLGGCKTGDAKITKGYDLPCKHVIHTVGPRGFKPDVLKQAYDRCFEVMLENQLRTIAFPCISTGVYGFPNKPAAKIAIETTRQFLDSHSSLIDAVVFCLFTDKDIDVYHEVLPSYFPLQPYEPDEGVEAEQ